MKKIVIICGLISGSICSLQLAIGMSMTYKNPDFEGSMVVGFASMILAFSLIYVGIKMFRDKYNGGVLTFGRAFTAGLQIVLIASTMYVATWAIQYKYTMPDFMDKYTAHMISKAESEGLSQVEMKEKLEKINMYQNMYKNPIYFTLITYMEILPVGIIISLISALILQRKHLPQDAPAK